MKNMFDEISKFSMADDADDYDEYEEEFIERDEEYDDGEEEYEDEEYDDEEYEDDYDDEEEYEEEEPYEEEYDDGYDDQYYDDRLNQVLDELAELKRNMAQPVAAQPQQPFSPIQPHLLFSIPQQSNEVVMYNEISRLRDELSKTQNSQSLHVELSRLKEDMEREKRQNETQFLSEIKRLNEKIEELQQPAQNRAALSGGQTAGYLPEPAPQHVPQKELGKLVGISESLLKSTRESDSRIVSDVGEVKTNIADVKSNISDVKTNISDFKSNIDEVYSNVSEVKTAVADVKTKLESMSDDELKAALTEIKETLKTLEERPLCVDSSEAIGSMSDVLAEIAASIIALKNSVGENTGVGSIDKKLLNKIARIKPESGGVDLTEIIRSVYELKGMLGSNDPDRQALVNMALKAYTDLDLLHATLNNSIDFRSKLEAVENFVSAVNAQDFITTDALGAYDIVVKELLDTPLDRSVFDSLCSFATATGKITVSSAKKDAVNKFIAFSERAKREDIDTILEFLPEMVAARNDAEGSKNLTANSGLYDDIISVNEERLSETDDAEKRASEAEIKALIAELSDLRVGDVASYSPAMPLPTSDAVSFDEGDSVSDRINALTQSIAELSDSVNAIVGNSAASSGEKAFASDDIAATAVQPEIMSGAENLTGELENLKSALYALNAKLNLEELSAAINQNFADVTARLADIEAGIAGGIAVSDNVSFENAESADSNEIIAGISEKIDAMADDGSREVVLGELAEIKEKLAETGEVINQINDLRADLAVITESVGSSAQFDKLFDDIAAQFDKLYDDLTAVDGETAEKFDGKLTEIKETLDGLVASDLSASVLDGIVDFRASYEENKSLSAADREKILEDLAFVREQVQNRLDAQANETINNEELAARIAGLQEEFSDNIKALEDKIAELDVSTTNEQYAQASEKLSEQLVNLTETVDEFVATQDEADKQALEERQNIIAAIDELKEKSSSIEDVLATNGLLAADNQNALIEELRRILDQIVPAQAPDGSVGNVLYDEITQISFKLEEVRAAYEQANGEISATLAEIKEQVHLKELEQSLAAVSASEEEKKTLLTEVAALRERLSGIESAQEIQANEMSAQFAAIAERIDSLGGAATSQAAPEVKEAIEKLDTRLSDYIASDVTAANMDLLLNNLNDIKTVLESDGIKNLGEQTVEDVKRLLEEVSVIKEKLLGNAGEDSALNMQILMADVADIKDKLSSGFESVGDFVRMQDDLTFIRNQIEANIDGAPEENSIAETLENEGMSIIMDDIATIKEKLAAFDEYDTVSEILSLREDVKAARMLDNTDMTAELENLRNDLLELKSDLSDIKAVKSDGETVVSANVTPTGDEVNMLLGEIVSLRDEIQAYKDDVANILNAQSESRAEENGSDENVGTILDEIAGLHSEIAGVREVNFAEQADEIDAIKTALSEIRDMISRRTTISDDGAQSESVGSNELNVVLDEIINLRDEITALKSDFAETKSATYTESEQSSDSEIAALADEIAEFKTELYSLNEKLNAVSDNSALTEELQNLNAQIADLQTLAIGGAVAETDFESRDSIMGELNEIKEMLAASAENVVSDAAVSLDDLYGEMLSLRQDMENIKLSQPIATDDGNFTVDLAPINDQLFELREQLANMPVQNAVEAEPDTAVLEEVLTLRDELSALREQLANMPAQNAVEAEPDTAVLEEVLTLRDELSALREQLANMPVQNAVEAEPDTTVLSEILGMREELEKLREGAASDETAGLIEAVDSIKEDVRAIKEEPDLSIINEVLALRDEFQAFKDELNKTRTAPAETHSKDELVSEVQSLRDQLFAISMANVNDGTSNDVVYESYNNIILDEISALRDELALIKKSSETRELSDELSQMKDKLTNIAIDDSEKTEASFNELRAEIAALKNRENDVVSETVLNELSALKEEIANQREADATTLNFMSEMARLLERQNEYINRASDEKIREEIEELKAEIAASVALSASADDLREQIDGIKQAVSRNAVNSAVADNGAVLKEIASLRAELGKQNFAEENKKILREISRIKDEIGALSERDSTDGGELSRSINDLKTELNQLAGFVDDEAQTPRQPKKQASSRSKSSRKTSSAKSGTKKKSQPSKTESTVLSEESGLTTDSLISKIDATSIDISGFTDDNMLVMNPDFVTEQAPIPATSVEMDIASRLAKQVANKLIMEQLVQQLGDGDVPHSEVEEIVRDILPQEFTTIQVDEQTDKVRRLANSLVLDKLRSRLKK
ncbi:MAG: hypothetical protein HFE35_08365 [Clostridia bacterium]|nr:hypothetical protein [Clostridia bacterium]